MLPSDDQIAVAINSAMSGLGYSPVDDTIGELVDKVYYGKASDYVTHFMIDYGFITCPSRNIETCDVLQELVDRGLITKEDYPYWSDWFSEEEDNE